LYQIGSLTKAYTGLAILLLEDEGVLFPSDPVTKYIPWLTFTYQGSIVKSEDFTIAALLYQTSGLTNDENTYPQASKLALI
jgi:CubicO group peptidase (beta-lactamase class C family)